MRRTRVPIIPAVVAAAMIFAVAPAVSRASDGGAVPVPGTCGIPIISGYDIDAIGRVLDTISSPARRDALAENWMLFAKQSIAKSLDLGQQWVDIQKAQLQNQTQADQYQAEVLKLQMQVEQLHNQNLALENENLKMRLQLQQQSGQSPSATPPKTQSP
jgi:hypothetical protein